MRPLLPQSSLPTYGRTDLLEARISIQPTADLDDAAQVDPEFLGVDRVAESGGD